MIKSFEAKGRWLTEDEIVEIRGRYNDVPQGQWKLGYYLDPNDPTVKVLCVLCENPDDPMVCVVGIEGEPGVEKRTEWLGWSHDTILALVETVENQRAFIDYFREELREVGFEFKDIEGSGSGRVR